MLPAFLITTREVLEAILIVATMLGILRRLDQSVGVNAVILGSAAATVCSIILLLLGSIAGYQIHEVYEAHEQYIEGVLLIVSASFITWAVFFLHQYFGSYKTALLVKIRTAMEARERRGIFLLAFTAVFREGVEIVLFLSTIFFSEKPIAVIGGFSLGVIVALMVSYGVFTAALRLPVYYAFRLTSILLIVFAAGMLARGVHEFSEVGWFPQYGAVTIHIMPSKTWISEVIQGIFGISRSMDIGQIALYSLYIIGMVWWVFFRTALPSSGRHSRHLTQNHV